MFQLPFDFGYILIGINGLSAIFGLACAIVGGILRFNLDYYINDYIGDIDADFYETTSDGMITTSDNFSDVDLGDWYIVIGSIAIVVGVLVISYSTLGIVSGVLKQNIYLFVLIGIILLATLFEFILLWMIMDIDSSFHDDYKDDLVTRLSSDYQLGPQANEFSQVMNALMITGECCGIRSWEDFNSELTYEMGGLIRSLRTSSACCKNESWAHAAASENFTDVLFTCTEHHDQFFHDGCYDAVFDDAESGQLGTYQILLILIIIWQCVIMAAAVLMVFQPKGEDKSKQAALDEAELEAERKKFTPFSKLSSMPTSDINRIKSTEIWNVTSIWLPEVEQACNEIIMTSSDHDSK